MADRYPIIVFWSDEDEAYIAEIPDLFACSAFGPTAEEAVAEVQRAKAAWLASAREHGDPIPAPSSPPARALAMLRRPA
ncbi:MAG TPA: type II toxin-antitoxin system HicB family antitoxin [Thermomicrobiales bacterium]|nr:type II toxin-antitoxin system HicB family antitoxin [Thermomicrobiales bacterium]